MILQFMSTCINSRQLVSTPLFFLFPFLTPHAAWRNSAWHPADFLSERGLSCQVLVCEADRWEGRVEAQR